MTDGARPVLRWKYKTETVTVDENSVTVRGLTAGERVDFLKHQEAVKTIKAGEEKWDPHVSLRFLAKRGIVSPELTDADLETMPGDLLIDAVDKILDLSGMKQEKKATEPEPEPS